MYLKNLCDDISYGKCGEKANFTDTNGDNLYVGDVVRIKGIDELSIVCKDNEDKSFNIMGIWGSNSFTKIDSWQIFKEKSYKSMKEGDKIRGINYCDETPIKEMTIAEIEKELGYSIKIIKEN